MLNNHYIMTMHIPCIYLCMCLYSSHPVWEESKRFGHYKAVPNLQREVLENLYKTALNSRQEEDLLVNIPDTHLQV